MINKHERLKYSIIYGVKNCFNEMFYEHNMTHEWLPSVRREFCDLKKNCALFF